MCRNGKGEIWYIPFVLMPLEDLDHSKIPSMFGLEVGMLCSIHLSLTWIVTGAIGSMGMFGATDPAGFYFSHGPEKFTKVSTCSYNWGSLFVACVATETCEGACPWKKGEDYLYHLCSNRNQLLILLVGLCQQSYMAHQSLGDCQQLSQRLDMEWRPHHGHHHRNQIRHLLLPQR